jgi:FkbM family methyltransferase
VTTHPFISFAQNREDVVLFRALGHITNGRYLDVGANDPTADSVTRAFYDRGWHGMSIDPVRTYAQAHRDQRPGDVVYEVAATDSTGTVTLYEVPDTGLSSLHENVTNVQISRGREVRPVEVPARRLGDLLTETGWQGLDIHFMSLDVEGAEAEVLAGADLGTWRPWVIVVESLEPDTALPSHERWQPQLEAAGYRFVLFDGLNRFFIADEHWDELHDKLSAPANVLDNFESARSAELAHQVDRLRAELSECRAELDGLRAHHLSVVDDREILLTDRGRIYRRAEELTHEIDATRDRERAALASAVAWRTKATAAWTTNAAANGLATSAEVDRLRAATAGLTNELAAIRATLSWRITRPLRAVRRRTRVTGHR